MGWEHCFVLFILLLIFSSIREGFLDVERVYVYDFCPDEGSVIPPTSSPGQSPAPINRVSVPAPNTSNAQVPAPINRVSAPTPSVPKVNVPAPIPKASGGFTVPNTYHPDVFLDPLNVANKQDVRFLVCRTKLCNKIPAIPPDMIRNTFLGNHRDSVRNVLAAVSYGRWDLRPEDFVIIDTVFEATSCVSNFGGRQAIWDPVMAYLNSNGLRGYWNIVIQSSINMSEGGGGGIILNDRMVNAETMVHEYAHGKGPVGHAYQSGGSDDPTTVMAPVLNGQYFMAPLHAERLSIAYPIATLQVPINTPTTFQLPSYSKVATNFIKIIDSKNTAYSICFRTGDGYDARLTPYYRNKLSVHRLDGNDTMFTGVCDTRETSTKLIPGVSITLDGINNGYASMTIRGV